MKKQLLLLVVMLLPLVANADAIDIDGIYYNLNTDAKTAEVAKHPNKYSSCVNIPSSVKYEGTDYEVTSIGTNAFSRCDELFCVVIGKNVTTIASNAFSRGKLTSVWALMETPPAITGSTFSANTKATLHVPANSIEAYRNADNWNSSFVDIVAIDKNPLNDDPIAFADAKVKALCIANWDTNGDGELSEREALMVTDLKNVFSQNKTITSFEELSYFSNISSIGDNEFTGCSNLTSISIPLGVSSIGMDAFSACNSLIHVWAYMKTPPRIGSVTFSNCTNATLHVPVNSISTYRRANYWSQFLNIVAISNKPLSNNPIVFADANVKALCVANWDTNGDGELSEMEASLVMDLKGVFSQNETITSFDELSYFISLQRFADNEFKGCSNLTSISIPYCVASIGHEDISYPTEAFSGCTNLLKVELHCDAIVSYDFNQYGSGLCGIFGDQVEEYILGDEITSIGMSAFRGAYYMKSIKISDNVTRIGSCAFEWCYGNLRSITLPNSLRDIGGNAFHGCSLLTSIIIPANVGYIGQEAFYGCPLSRVYCLAKKMPSTEDLPVFIGTNYLKGTLHVPANLIDTYRNSGKWNGFGNIVALESAVDGLYYNFDDNAKTAKIISITQDLNGAVAIPSTINYGGGQYNVTSIGSSAFLGCSNLTSVTIPNNITSIGDGAFSYCTSLTSAVLGEGVADIGESAFSNCTSLISIAIPSSVTSIGKSAFSYCPALTSIKVEKGNAIYDSRNNCNAIIETATNTLWTGCKKTVIPEDVTKIGDNAFSSCYDLTSVNIPDGVTEIGVEAFANCTGLTSIAIPGSVTTIGAWAFFGCESLTAVYITNLTAWCGFDFSDFYGNTTNPLCFAQHLYLNGKEVTELVIPEGVQSIGHCTFQKLTNLTSVVIPSSVTKIGGNAFSGCLNMTNVYCYAEQVPEMKEQAESDSYSYSYIWGDWPNATLHVPAGSIEDYRNSYNWKNFGNIVALTDSDPKPTGIDEVKSQFSDVKGAFFDLNGRRMNGEPTQKGVYIQNGKKIIVK